jgi:hypothetical protein
MRWSEQDWIEYRAWIEKWWYETPLPPNMNKKERWRAAGAAWCEMRRLQKKQERQQRQAARDASAH